MGDERREMEKNLKFTLRVLFFLISMFSSHYLKAFDQEGINLILSGNCEGAIKDVYQYPEFFAAISISEECANEYINGRFKYINEDGLIEIIGLLAHKGMISLSVRFYEEIIKFIDKDEAQFFMFHSSFHGIDAINYRKVYSEMYDDFDEINKTIDTFENE